MSIASEIQRLQTAKADLKAAIEAKGVTVPSSATIDAYDDYVSQISGGGGGLTQDVSGTPYCDGEDQVVDVQRQISVDGGTSWVNSGSQFTVIVEAGACGGGLIQIPYGTDMTQYYNRYIKRIVIGDTSYSNGDCQINNWGNVSTGYITVATWGVYSGGDFSGISSLPIDTTPANPVQLLSWNYDNSTTNPFNNLQIEWV